MKTKEKIVTEEMIHAGALAMAGYDLERLEMGMGVERELIKIILEAALSDSQ